mmetsp:Transcript_49817/g.161436  ORF Transcript_49817/g.161436 Transcript_49817/m.161436 type:complete len:139 (-) Transcript_49817:142-558(-)
MSSSEKLLVRLSALALLAGCDALRLPPSPGAPAFSRRSLLAGLSSAAALGATRAAHAEGLGDLDAPEEAAAPIKVSAVQAVTIDASKPKQPKVAKQYARMEELKKKGDLGGGGLTDKERKELNRLKAEEMCEMLGRGC